LAENGLLINTRVGVPTCTIPVTRLLDALIHTLSRKMSEAPTALAMDHDVTVQAVIFDPAAFVGRTVRVAGKCVLLDLALGRLDIAANGAKLIVQLEHVDNVAAHVRRGGGGERKEGNTRHALPQLPELTELSPEGVV